METNCYTKLYGARRQKWVALLESEGLRPGDDAEMTVVVEEDDQLLATGSRCGNILKYIAVDPSARGMNLTATVLTPLQKDAFMNGYSHLFLYTKPKNRLLFEGAMFFPVEETRDVLLMENRRDGLTQFLETQKALAGNLNGDMAGNLFGKQTVIPAGNLSSGETSEKDKLPIGAVVMNCNPFTLGHRYLIETARSKCSHLYVFVLSEDKSEFPAEDRLRLVKEGTADLGGVTVLETGDYLISSATFPDYFLRAETSATEAQCALDCRIFARHFAPVFGITHRFAGSEPNSRVTESYNRTMEKVLPELGVMFTEIPRMTTCENQVISAKYVRSLLEQGRGDELKKLVPWSTFRYLEERRLV